MARHNRSKRRHPFVDLPRHRRADKWFELKHEIAKGPYENFTCHSYLDEGVSWLDIFFLGPDKFTYWNVYLGSAPYTLDSEARNRAIELVEADLTAEQREARRTFNHFGPRSAHGTRQWIHDDTTYEQFDGRTWFEEIRLRSKTLTAEDLDLRAEIAIDRDYASGIGLHVVLDVPILTEYLITEWIKDFPSLGITGEKSGVRLTLTA